MTEEIKEILVTLSKHGILSCEQDIFLLDYITNLEQENKKLKEQINEIKRLDRLQFNTLISHYGILKGDGKRNE